MTSDIAVQQVWKSGRAMEPAFYLSTWGRRWGFRLMRHLCRHVRITIIVIIGLARPVVCPGLSLPPLRDWRDGRVYVRIGCRGRTRAGQDARTKIDEDEMKESWYWAGWGSCTCCVVSELVCPRPLWKPVL